MPVADRRVSTLPSSLAPRGLNRVQAAEYIGVSPSLFDVMMRDGRMPQPKVANSRRLWDIRRLDEAFAALPDAGDSDANQWDTLLGPSQAA